MNLFSILIFCNRWTVIKTPQTIAMREWKISNTQCEKLIGTDSLKPFPATFVTWLPMSNINKSPQKRLRKYDKSHAEFILCVCHYFEQERVQKKRIKLHQVVERTALATGASRKNSFFNQDERRCGTVGESLWSCIIAWPKNVCIR